MSGKLCAICPDNDVRVSFLRMLAYVELDQAYIDNIETMMRLPSSRLM